MDWEVCSQQHDIFETAFQEQAVPLTGKINISPSSENTKEPCLNHKYLHSSEGRDEVKFPATQAELPVCLSHPLISNHSCLYLFLLTLIKHSLPPHPAANQSASTTTLCGVTVSTCTFQISHTIIDLLTLIFKSIKAQFTPPLVKSLGFPLHCLTVSTSL